LGSQSSTQLLMSFGRLAVAAASVLGLSFVANAFEVRTFQYDVPNQASFPGTWPPPNFAVGPIDPFFGGWNTSADAVVMQIASPGLQIPRLEEMFTLAGVPEWLQGSLLQVTIRVQGYVYIDYTVDNGGATATAAGLTLSGTIATRALTETAPVTFPAGPDVMSVIVSRSVTTPIVPADDADNPADFVGIDSYSSFVDGQGEDSETYVSGNPEFTLFNNNSGNGFIYLPIRFSSPGASVTSGNFGTQTDPFGSALVTVTYTFLPESDYLLGALPVVFAGWVIRRKVRRA
jgi:hypothetical protein